MRRKEVRLRSKSAFRSTAAELHFLVCTRASLSVTENWSSWALLGSCTRRNCRTPGKGFDHSGDGLVCIGQMLTLGAELEMMAE